MTLGANRRTLLVMVSLICPVQPDSQADLVSLSMIFICATLSVIRESSLINYDF